MKTKLKKVLISLLLALSIGSFTACDPGIDTIGSLGGEMGGDPYQMIVEQLIDQLKDTMGDEIRSAILQELNSGTLDGLLQEKFNELVDNQVKELLDEQSKQIQELLTKQLNDDQDLRDSFINEILKSDDLRNTLKQDQTFLDAMKDEIMTNSDLQDEVLQQVMESGDLTQKITEIVTGENSELKTELLEEYFSDEVLSQKILNVIKSDTDLTSNLASTILDDTDAFGAAVLNAVQNSQGVSEAIAQQMISEGLSESILNGILGDEDLKNQLLADVFSGDNLSDEIEKLFLTDPSITDKLIEAMLNENFAEDLVDKLFEDKFDESGNPIENTAKKSLLDNITGNLFSENSTFSDDLIGKLLTEGLADDLIDELMKNDFANDVISELLDSDDDGNPSEFMQKMTDPNGDFFKALLADNSTFLTELTTKLTAKDSAFLNLLLDPAGPLMTNEAFLQNLVDALIGTTTADEQEAILRTLWSTHPHLFNENPFPEEPTNPYGGMTYDDLYNDDDLYLALYDEIYNSHDKYNSDNTFNQRLLRISTGRPYPGDTFEIIFNDYLKFKYGSGFKTT